MREVFLQLRWQNLFLHDFCKSGNTYEHLQISRETFSTGIKARGIFSEHRSKGIFPDVSPACIAFPKMMWDGLFSRGSCEMDLLEGSCEMQFILCESCDIRVLRGSCGMQSSGGGWCEKHSYHDNQKLIQRWPCGMQFFGGGWCEKYTYHDNQKHDPPPGNCIPHDFRRTRFAWYW